MNVEALARQLPPPAVLTGAVSVVADVDHPKGGPTAFGLAWFDGRRRERIAGVSFRRPGQAAEAAIRLNGGSPASPGRPQPAPAPGGVAERVGVAPEAPGSRTTGASGDVPAGGIPRPDDRDVATT